MGHEEKVEEPKHKEEPEGNKPGHPRTQRQQQRCRRVAPLVSTSPRSGRVSVRDTPTADIDDDGGVDDDVASYSLSAPIPSFNSNICSVYFLLY